MQIQAAPCNTVTGHSETSLFRRASSPCHASALPIASLPCRHCTTPHLSLASRRSTLPYRNFTVLYQTVPPHSSTYHCHYLSLHLATLLILGSANLCLSVAIQRFSIAILLCTIPGLAFTVLYAATQCRHLTVQFLCSATLSSSIAIPIPALPSLRHPASPCNAISSLCKEKGGSYAFPPITFPLSSSSSQTNRPLPLLRHWPRPWSSP